MILKFNTCGLGMLVSDIDPITGHRPGEKSLDSGAEYPWKINKGCVSNADCEKSTTSKCCTIDDSTKIGSCTVCETKPVEKSAAVNPSWWDWYARRYRPQLVEMQYQPQAQYFGGLGHLVNKKHW